VEHLHHQHNPALIFLSILIAIFASYTALDLTNSVSTAKGKLKWLWLSGGSLAMGIGIWSMHFIGMLAFHVKGLNIYYDVPLMFLSIVVAVIASALALYIVSSHNPSAVTYTAGSVTMGAAIAGMHYIGIWSMRMSAHIMWDWTYVFLSVAIAFTASYVALLIAFRLRTDLTLKGFLYRGLGGILMGFAIAGMHYTGMAAMHLMPDAGAITMNPSDLLASDGLAASVIVGTIVILGIALSGSNVERALSKKTNQNESLQASLSARDEFFSVASHELKTPLTSIKLQNDLLIRAIQTDRLDHDKILAMLVKNGRNIERINRLIDDMLDTSRVSSGKLTLQKEHCELSSLVGDVLARYKPILEQAKCQVTFMKTKPIEGNWDRYRLEQVVTNLLTNAAKYAPGNPVIIKVDAQENAGIISIKDFGKGITEENQQKIFNRFERGNREGDMKGLGLGLFISKEIIEMHNGTISVESKDGEGTEFIVKLPVA
jgi:NO-binding membrane sensor protein with MHYT domain/nitrogen-specific signal transduction histidine kinase